jgi:hypothetical protein
VLVGEEEEDVWSVCGVRVVWDFLHFLSGAFLDIRFVFKV